MGLLYETMSRPHLSSLAIGVSLIAQIYPLGNSYAYP